MENQLPELQDELQVENYENEGNVAPFFKHEYHKYICEICNHIYDEAAGEPNVGLAPGTLWEDLAEDWRCPECSAIKSNFKFLG